MVGIPFVEVRDLHRTYGPLAVLRGLSFELQTGEVLGLLGPNGAGKTTTLQILSGALTPSSGRVSIGGKDLIAEPRACKLLLGYLPEHPPLYPELTVDEYLGFCARLRQLRRARVPAAVKRVREQCGLEDTGRRLIGNLSKGFQQRVGIAQAIIHSPPLVILDEPTVGLDPIQIREIRRLIRELAGEHSIILSTHILAEAQAVCDRVQIINRGQIMLSETVDRVTGGRPGGSVQVAFEAPPGINEIEAISGIESVESLGSGRFRLRCIPNSGAREQLLSESLGKRWGLCELTPERHSLEEVFVRLIAGEEEPAALLEPRA